MNGFGPPSAPTTVRVEVKGSLDVPIQLGLLAELGDPVMEQEIIKEAVRIAVSEKLGCFDGVDVRLSTSGGRGAVPAKPNGEQHQQQLGAAPTATAAAAATRHSYAHRYCEAEVDLQRLGGCIEAIQGAYENLLVHVHLLKDVLHGAGPFPSPQESCCVGAVSAPSSPSAETVSGAPPPLSVPTPSDAASCGNMALMEDATIGASGNGDGNAASRVNLSVAYADATQRLAAARHLVETALRDRQPDVVREAAAQHKVGMLCREEDILARERGRRLVGNEDEDGVTGNGARPCVHHCMDHEDGVDAELRRGLLADEDDDGAAAPLENEDERDEDDMDEETAHDRYLRQGYSPL